MRVSVNNMRSTVRIPKDAKHRHQITIPIELWEGLKLMEGKLILVDIEEVKS